jgi:hypothetical protein
MLIEIPDDMVNELSIALTEAVETIRATPYFPRSYADSVGSLALALRTMAPMVSHAAEEQP